jgi:FAD/FMN-containing dehydrogenase
MTAMDLSTLKEKLSAVVGKDGVCGEASTLAGFESAGLTSGGRPLFAVRPAGTPQVRELVRLANAEGLNLVFSSSGPPRFRGDTVPDGEGVIVDMSGMDRVLRVDRRNKVALIEPGVTFARLKEEASKAGMLPLMPLLPRSTKSVIASFLERDPITIPRHHWDMTDPLLCTELVFGTGDLFRTGSAAGPGSLQQQWDQGLAQKNPMGPAQTDFLRIVQGSQGTMAAVTWATLKLELEPALHRLHFVPTDRLERLVDVSYRALRPKLGEEFFILNSFALATMLSDDPAEICDLAGRQAPYTLVYGAAGFEYLPEQRLAYQEQDMERIVQACGVRVAREVPGVSSRRMLDIVTNPSPEPYYKTRARGAFLDILFLTTLDRAPALVAVAERAAARYGYPPGELGLYIQPIQHGRTCHMELNIYYDPGDAAGAARARELFDDASMALDEAGAFFSRPYGRWADMAYGRCPDTVLALRKVKEMLDPAGVLNRGKLCFGDGPREAAPGEQGGKPGEVG